MRVLLAGVLAVLVLVLAPAAASAADVGVRGEVVGGVFPIDEIENEDDGDMFLGLGALGTVRLGRWLQLGASWEGAGNWTHSMTRVLGWIGATRRTKHTRTEILVGAGQQRFWRGETPWYSDRFTVGVRLGGYANVSPNVDLGLTVGYNRDFGGDRASNVLVFGVALAFHSAYY